MRPTATLPSVLKYRLGPLFHGRPQRPQPSVEDILITAQALCGIAERPSVLPGRNQDDLASYSQDTS